MLLVSRFACLMGGLLVALCATGSCRSVADESLVVGLGDAQRTYLEYVPKLAHADAPAPLLLVFHGGGGSAAKAKKAFGFQKIADAHGVLLAFPDAVEGHWNDGRGGEKFAAQDAKTDDVAYSLSVTADMQARHRVDPNRIYAVGVSNGGMFVQRLAIEQAETFAAVASIISSIPEPLGETFEPTRPLSILFMNGTEDPIVPFGGGEVTIDFFPRLAWKKDKASRGRVMPTEAAAMLWVRRAQLDPEPVVSVLPDRDKHDDTTVELWDWSAKDSDVEVALYRIVGGGHSLPGGKQYLSKSKIGNTSGDIDAVEVTWAFFASKRRQP